MPVRPTTLDAAALRGLARRVVHDARAAAGGHSGETFTGLLFGRQVVVRLYVSAPHRAAVDAALLRRLWGRIPVPRLVDVQPDPARGLPPYLVTERVHGATADQLLQQGWSPNAARALGRQCARVVQVLRDEQVAQAGELLGPSLAVGAWPPEARTLVAWHDAHVSGLRLAGLGPEQSRGLRAALAAADARLERTQAEAHPPSLVHGDLNGKNIVADPDTGRLRAVLDWEFAHGGDWLEDVGNLLREATEHAGSRAGQAFAEGITDVMDEDEHTPESWRRRAVDLDLFALVELAARPDGDATARGPVRTAREQLRLLGR